MRKVPTWPARVGCALTVLVLAGCAASLSEIEGRYSGTPKRESVRQGVRLEFFVTHLEQSHGWDVIPKHRSAVVEAFDEVLRDATSEFTNLASYTLVTDEGPKGKGEVEIRREYRTDRDYVVHLTILRESSFAAHTFWGLIALSTGTFVPAPFRWQYTIDADVYDSAGNPTRRLRRSATLTNWIQAGLVFVYPFHPLEGKEEKLYSDVLHDLFRQMEAEGIVAPPRHAT